MKTVIQIKKNINKKASKVAAVLTCALLVASMLTPFAVTKVFADGAPVLTENFTSLDSKNPDTTAYNATTQANIGDTITFNLFIKNTGSAPASNVIAQIDGFHKDSNGNYVTNSGTSVALQSFLYDYTTGTTVTGNNTATVVLPSNGYLKFQTANIYWRNNANPSAPIAQYPKPTDIDALFNPDTTNGGLDLSQLSSNGQVNGDLPNQGTAGIGEFGCIAEVALTATVVGTQAPSQLNCTGITATPSNSPIPNGTAVTLVANGTGATSPVNVTWSVNKNGQTQSTTDSNIQPANGNVTDTFSLLGTADQNTTANYTINAVMANTQGQTSPSQCQVSFAVTGPSVQGTTATPSVAITKTLNTAGVIHVGDNLSFKVVITDNGNNKLTQVGFTDNYNQSGDQGKISFVNATATETIGSNTTASVVLPMNFYNNNLSLQDLTKVSGFQTLNPGDSITLTLNFTANQVGSTTDTATVNAVAENGQNLTQNATASATISPVAVAPNTGASDTIVFIAGLTTVAAIITKKYLLKSILAA